MKAPDFTLPASNGENVTLSQFRGKYIVLYFYPKDMTPGCTTEACEFRDQYEVFTELGAVVIGISPDSIERHKKFIEKHRLPFLLLADEKQDVAKLYDVWKLKKNFGKEYMGIERSTFLIDPDGQIIKEWRKVKVNGHVEEVLNALKQAISSNK
ncbi:thioredoxin-dependent thiol peroxidase [Anoxybacillus sp. LAT_35]|uniref:thioredoxin-dependent thiol peroxidase n=1 Tax=Anoxybacillus TaxID=150247 RepID=UPI001EDAA28C|nr:MULTISPECIES: thioredoxin-dependent thiol peroxidase [Anoxybacillus]MCG5026497.1 thioredoxin-dependent thiol peroxidase [Anoxybacillus flavithermus]MCG6196481.1 thioredoxin-dependent thiol peroxidase [Anoxybacillus sp. LAT_38]MCG3084462.1 thioredoxin-dependent thiol peroxidase [Anoxybacillus sp. LAT27]MCG6172231.1 thioredoxin-dependent thiol peroxidase [Anoxybacillus sp. LAT_11]MCG6176248.1 thioredoxin-dependent thiol peroxidase [Anoxybacillus sp. LAT_31]